jgi:hypothetical protein
MFSAFHVVAAPDSLSVKKIRPKAIYDVSYQRHDVNAFTGIDTSIFQLHRNDFVNRDGAEYFHLGNVGTAAFPIIFNPVRKKISAQVFLNLISTVIIAIQFVITMHNVLILN